MLTYILGHEGDKIHVNEALTALKKAGFISEDAYSNGAKTRGEIQIAALVEAALFSRAAHSEGKKSTAQVAIVDRDLRTVLNQEYGINRRPELTLDRLMQILDASYKSSAQRIAGGAEPLPLNPQDEDSLWTSLSNTVPGTRAR